MSLKNKVQEEIKKAMIAKNKIRLDAIRSIKSAILLAETDKLTKNGLDEQKEILLLQKLVKQRKDSAELYKNQNREDLYSDEIGQAQIIEEFLPKQLLQEELINIVKKIILKEGATSIAQMGIIIKKTSEFVKGGASNKKISEIVKQELSS